MGTPRRKRCIYTRALLPAQRPFCLVYPFCHLLATTNSPNSFPLASIVIANLAAIFAAVEVNFWLLRACRPFSYHLSCRHLHSNLDRLRSVGKLQSLLSSLLLNRHLHHLQHQQIPFSPLLEPPFQQLQRILHVLTLPDRQSLNLFLLLEFQQLFSLLLPVWHSSASAAFSPRLAPLTC